MDEIDQLVDRIVKDAFKHCDVSKVAFREHSYQCNVLDLDLLLHFSCSLVPILLLKSSIYLYSDREALVDRIHRLVRKTSFHFGFSVRPFLYSRQAKLQSKMFSISIIYFSYFL